jgi:hypothetical protein
MRHGLSRLNGWNGLNEFQPLCVRPLADHNHTIVVKDDHFSSVGFLQDGGVEHLLRATFGDQTAIEADDPGQMRRHPVEIVGRNDDSHALVVDLMKEMDDVVP